MGAKSADRGFGRGLAFHGFATMVVPNSSGMPLSTTAEGAGSATSARSMR